MSLNTVSGLLIATALLQLFLHTNGQPLSPCHADIFQFTSRHSLDIPRYMGDWYLQEIAGSFINNFPEPDFGCAKYALSNPNPEDPLNIDLLDYWANITDGVNHIDYKNISVNASRSPLNSLWSQRHDEDGVEISTKIIILSADLEFGQWTVIYSCALRGPFQVRREVVIAMTRERNIEPELRNRLKALMVGQGFRIGDMWPISQNNCTDV